MLAKPNTADELGAFQSKVADIIAFGRYRGYLPAAAATKRELLDGQVNTQVKKAGQILQNSGDRDRQVYQEGSRRRR